MNSSLRHDAIFRKALNGKSGRCLTYPEAVRWGALVSPAPDEGARTPKGGLRVVAMTSFTVGHAALQAITADQRARPGVIDLVAVATDEATNSEAKIGLRKRAWKWLTDQGRFDLLSETVETGLAAGAPVYTGELKTAFFRSLLADLRPDVILCCCLGQVLDASITESVPLGAYNLHPSDLGKGHGAGYEPHADAFERRAETARWTIHRITDVLDGGPIVTVSPSVSIRNRRGALPPTPMHYYDRMNSALPSLISAFLDVLVERHHHGPRAPLGYLPLASGVAADVRNALIQPLEWAA